MGEEYYVVIATQKKTFLPHSFGLFRTSDEAMQYIRKNRDLLQVDFMKITYSIVELKEDD